MKSAIRIDYVTSNDCVFFINADKILSDGIMEAISSQWNDWNENAKISISLPCYIEQIVTYPASYQSFNYWKYKLKKAREKLICQDCVVVDKDGYKLRKEFST